MSVTGGTPAQRSALVLANERRHKRSVLRLSLQAQEPQALRDLAEYLRRKYALTPASCALVEAALGAFLAT